MNNGLTNNANENEICFTASNVILPTSGYIGISAATGGLAGRSLGVRFRFISGGGGGEAYNS